MFIFFILAPIFLIQSYGQERDYQPEIYLESINVPAELSITYSFTEISLTFCNSWINLNHFSLCGTCDNPADEIIVGNSNPFARYGWSICKDDKDTWDLVGFGLYEVNTNLPTSSARFFIDLRDANYAHNGYEQADFKIRYDYLNDWFEWRTVGAGNHQWQRIISGGLLQIWFIQQPEYNPITTPFSGFWESSLGYQFDLSTNHPRLVWGPHPNTAYNNGFNVYRAVVSPGQPEPAEGNFALLTPNGLSASTFTYTDGDINLGTNNNSLVYYFVKAKGNGSTLSAKTNTVDIDGRYIEIEKEKGNEEIEINNFSLSQNHPNPFNPTTTIVYQTPIDGIVNLSIYNLLGEKVAALVNDYKETGEYTVQFNASNLPSGTYIYTLTTNGKKISKKLSVMK